MIKKIFIVSLLAFVSLSCRKQIVLPAPGMERIFGEWEWVSSSGGFSGATITPVSQKETWSLVFHDNGKHKRKKNGKTEIKTKFSLYSQTDANGRPSYYIRYETGDLGDQAIFFDGHNKLVLTDLCADCYTSIYLRK